VKRAWLKFGIVFCIAAVLPTSAWADFASQRAILKELNFEQRMGNKVPLDIPFTNAAGERVTLGSLASDKPILLNMVYYECPMLCTLVLNGVLKALRVTSLNVYEDFDIVTISINPHETPQIAKEKKGYYVRKYNRPNADKGWHFLTGSQESIDAVAEAIGFTYVYEESTKQYAHAAGTVFLTPDGVISRYLFGIEYAPRDIRLALVEASENKIGNPIDRLLLYCFQYDPEEGKYGLLVMNVLRLAGLFTVLLLAGALLIMLRRERKTRLASVSTVASSSVAETGVGKK